MLNGSIAPSALVSMSATALATHELAEKREKICEANAEGRRTDWLEENKKEIQTTIGWHPNLIDYNQKLLICRIFFDLNLSYY